MKSNAILRLMMKSIEAAVYDYFTMPQVPH